MRTVLAARPREPPLTTTSARPDDARPPRGPLTALGILSLVAFGSWLYGFGVLIEPIREATGWAESLLTAAYGASLLLTGAGGAAAGHLIDRRGGRALFLGCAGLAPTALVAASFAGAGWLFAVLAAIAGGVIGAGGYYHATQAVIGRLAPEARARGMTGLTLWGAFASPVFLPLLGPVVLALGWRVTFRLLAIVVGAAFVTAGLAVPAEPSSGPSTDTPRESPFAAMRRTAQRPAVRRLYLAAFAMGAGTSVLLLYQVPAMVAAGLTLGTASAFAGARGFVQLAGRLPLPAVLRRTGSYRALRGSLVLTVAGALLLPFAGTIPVAVLFTAVAGVAIGALAALEGIYAADVTDAGVLGTTLGVFTLVRGVGSAVGPVAGGLLVDGFGSRAPALVLSAGAVAVALVVLRPPARRADGTDPADATDPSQPAAGAGP